MAAAFYGLLVRIVVRLMMQPGVKVLEVLVQTNEHNLSSGPLRSVDYPTSDPLTAEQFQQPYCGHCLASPLPGAPRTTPMSSFSCAALQELGMRTYTRIMHGLHHACRTLVMQTEALV
ncbi:hypothetical protein Tco_0497878 [Tanacetum coccineum]